MNIIKKIKNEINYFGVPKERRLDYYLKKLIVDKTGFKLNKIELLTAEKTKMETYNQFNCFTFKYNGKTYKLLDDELSILD